MKKVLIILTSLMFINFSNLNAKNVEVKQKSNDNLKSDETCIPSIKITIFGKGGVRGKRICPKTAPLNPCAVIETFTDNDNDGLVSIGDNVGVEVYSINGNVLFNGFGTLIFLMGNHAEVNFNQGDVFIDDPNDPS